MNRQDCIAFATPFLIGAAMLFCTTCSHAQTPPMQNEIAVLVDWQLVFNLTMSNRQSVSVVPRQPLTLSFPNTNSQPLDVTVQTSTNLMNWTQATNALAPANSTFEWVDNDINQSQKFYRVQVNWWF